AGPIYVALTPPQSSRFWFGPAQSCSSQAHFSRCWRPEGPPSALREFDRNITRTAVARHCCACAPVLDCANDSQKESYEEAEENRPKESDTSEGGEPFYEGGEEEAHAEAGRKEDGRCSETAPEDGARGRSRIPVRTSGAALR